jgi:small multidrug resistance pump
VGYLFLAIAIVSEVVATSSLKVASGDKPPVWALALVVVGYLLAFAMLRQTLAAGVPLGTAYAIWAGIGVVAVAVVGWRAFDEALAWPQVVGMGLVAVGVALIELGHGR